MVELRQQASFVDEASKPGRERVRVPLGSHRDGQTVRAAGKRRGHVFLERHIALQGMIVDQVHDPEAAFPDEAGDLEFAQQRADRKAVARIVRCRLLLGHRPGCGHRARHQCAFVVLRRGHKAHRMPIK